MIILLLRLTFYAVATYVAFRLYKYVSLKVTEHMSKYDDEMSAIASDDEQLTINPFNTEDMGKI